MKRLGMTPLAPAAGWLGRSTAVLRAPRFRDGFGRAVRLGGVASGAVMLTGGRCLCGTVLSCAAAGSAHTADEAAAENIRNKAPRTAMPPHDNCYSPQRLNQTKTGLFTLASPV